MLPHRSVKQWIGRTGLMFFHLNGCAALTIFIGILSVSIYPLLGHDIISINDLLNHLTRIWVILHYRDTPAFQEYFLVNWSVLPNLAIDVFVNIVARVVPLEVAGKLFIATVLALLMSGALFLHRAVFGKWSIWPFLTAIFLYNRLLLAGVTNYLFGVGLFLHAVALWISMRERPVAVRIAVSGVMALAIFFSHLFALGLLGVTILGYELANLALRRPPFKSAARDLIVAGVQFIPPILLVVLFMPRTNAGLIIEYRGLVTRLGAFAAPFLYDVILDAVSFLSLGAVVLWLAAIGALKIDVPLAVSIVLLLIVQLVMPNVLMTATGADHRIPIAVIFLLVCATDASTDRSALQICFAAVAAVVIVARLWAINAQWDADDAIYAEARAALAALPPGAKVATAFPSSAFASSSTRAIAIYYLPTWDIIPRGGFTQTLFAFPMQQPLLLQPRYRDLARDSPPDGLWQDFVVSDHHGGVTEPDARRSAALEHYEYIVFVHNARFMVRKASFLEPVHEGDHVRVYKLQREEGVTRSP